MLKPQESRKDLRIYIICFPINVRNPWIFLKKSHDSSVDPWNTSRSNSWRMVMLLANAIAVGVQTDYMAVNHVPSVPKADFKLEEVAGVGVGGSYFLLKTMKTNSSRKATLEDLMEKTLMFPPIYLKTWRIIKKLATIHPLWNCKRLGLLTGLTSYGHGLLHLFQSLSWSWLWTCVSWSKKVAFENEKAGGLDVFSSVSFLWWQSCWNKSGLTFLRRCHIGELERWVAPWVIHNKPLI